VDPYLPYLADTRRFDRRQAARATDGATPPQFTYEIFEAYSSVALSAR